MTILMDTLAAVRKMISLEERIAAQSRKLEQLAAATAELDKRLAVLEASRTMPTYHNGPSPLSTGLPRPSSVTGGDAPAIRLGAR